MHSGGFSFKKGCLRTLKAVFPAALIFFSLISPLQAASSVPKILNYQARLTDSGGVQVPNGALSVIFKLYDGSGTCLYSAQGSCGAPSAKSVTVTGGVFTTQIGSAAEGDNEIPDSLFDNNVVLLGITIGADAEMTPRKRLTATAYALNADRLDDLDVTSSGSTTAYIPSTTANGNLVITGDPQGTGISNGSVYINPATASGNETLFSIADNGSSRFQIDKEGDITTTGSLLATSASTTSQFVFRGFASQSTNIFEVQDALTNRLFSVSATSTLFNSDLVGYSVGIGNAAPASKLTVGSGTSTFEVDASGNVVKINNVVYSWPSTQGGASTVLQNNGSGVLTWAVSGGSSSLLQAFNSSTSANEIYVNGTQQALTIADQFTGGINKGNGVGSLFEIQDRTNATGDYSARFLTISSTSTLINPLNNVQNYKFAIGNAVPANMFTIGSATSTFEVNGTGNLVKVNNVAYSWPTSQGGTSTVLQNNGSGTLSWASGSGLVNLNQAYLNSTSSAEISLTPSIGAVTIADTFSGTGNIFEVQDRTNATGDYSNRYLTVSSTATNLTYPSTTTGLSFLMQSGSTANLSNGGVRFNFTGIHTGTGVQIDDVTTSGTVMKINANSINGGSGLVITANGMTGSSGSALAVNSTGTYTNAAGIVSVTATNATDGTVMVITANALAQGTALKVTSTSSYTGASGVFALSSNATSGTVQKLTAGALTTGDAISVSGTSNNTTTGTLLTLTQNPSAVVAAFTGSVASIAYTPQYTLTNTLSTGNVLTVTRNSTMNGSGLSPVIAGAVALFSDAVSLNGSGGTVKHGAPVVSILQTYTNATGTALTVTSSATGGGAAYFNGLFEPLVVAGNNPSPSTTLFSIQNTTAAGGVGYTRRYLTVSATTTLINPANIAGYAFGIGNAAPANRFTVGSATSTFEVDMTGNLIKVNNVPYSWPSSQGAASAVLTNNGSGVLTWSPASSTNLNQAYLASTSTAEISLTPSIGALTIADTFSGTGNIFEVQDRTNASGDYGMRYLAVSSTSTSIAGKPENRLSGYVMSILASDATNLGSASGTEVVHIETRNTLQTNKAKLLMLNGLGTQATDTVNAIQVNTTSQSLEQFHVTAAGSIYGAGSAYFGDGSFSDSVTINSGAQHTQALAVLADTIDNGTGAYLSLNSLTTGVGLHIASTALSVSSGSLIRASSATIGTLDTNGLISFSATSNYTSNSNMGLLNVSAPSTTTGTLFSLSGNAVTDGVVMSASATSLMTGTLLKLSAGGSNSRAYALAVNQSAGNLFTVSATGTVTATLPSAANFAVCHTGANGAVTNELLTDCAGSASADYMEMYPAASDLEMGDIVMPGAISLETLNGGRVPQVVKATAPYEGSMIGVISNPNDAGDFNSIGHEVRTEDHPMPVALKGRVKVKVTADNGPIKIGDPITSSSVPGVGMKSTKPGMIVGQALEAWNGPGQGLILVFMGNGWHSGLSITTDGMRSLFADDFAFKPLDVSSASGTSFSSYALSFGGSTWDSGANAAVTRNISIRNDITNKDTYQLAFKNNSGSTLATLNQSGDLALAGSLTVNGGFDYAETFPATPDLDAGDLVMVDPENTTGYGVKKSSSAYENTLIGVISTKPGFLTGKQGANTQPVALAGRVPVNVNTEAGEIKPGDPITSSSAPGVGMKAAEAGRVVGIALQGWNGTGVGTITVFVNPSWWNGPTHVDASTAGAALTISGETLLDFKNSTLSNVSAIVSTTGLWSLSADGYLTAQKVETKTVQAENLTLVQSETASSVSEGLVPSGYAATVVQNPFMTSNAKVFVSFLGDPGGGYWIGEKGEGNFTLHLAQPAIQDLPFEYWILGIDDRRPGPPIGTEDSMPPSSASPPTDPDATGSASGTGSTGSAPAGADSGTNTSETG